MTTAKKPASSDYLKMSFAFARRLKINNLAPDGETATLWMERFCEAKGFAFDDFLFDVIRAYDNVDYENDLNEMLAAADAHPYPCEGLTPAYRRAVSLAFHFARMNDQGRFFFGPKVAKALGVERRTVTNYLHYMTAKGLIECVDAEYKWGKDAKAKVYRFNGPRAVVKDVYQIWIDDDPEGWGGVTLATKAVCEGFHSRGILGAAPRLVLEFEAETWEEANGRLAEVDVTTRPVPEPIHEPKPAPKSAPKTPSKPKPTPKPAPEPSSLQQPQTPDSQQRKDQGVMHGPENAHIRQEFDRVNAQAQHQLDEANVDRLIKLAILNAPGFIHGGEVGQDGRAATAFAARVGADVYVGFGLSSLEDPRVSSVHPGLAHVLRKKVDPKVAEAKLREWVADGALKVALQPASA